MILPVAALLLAAACSDWTETESVENSVRKPWEQDPALWADYTAALRAYKQSEHYLSYARLYNSPAKAASEQDFMRCLPDSLDIVTLTNADNFSAYDAEDMAVMRERGRGCSTRWTTRPARRNFPPKRPSKPTSTG